MGGACPKRSFAKKCGRRAPGPLVDLASRSAILTSDQDPPKAEGFDPDVPQKPADARRFISGIVTSGQLIFSRHAREEMAKDGMVEQDVINVLRAGAVDPAEMEKGSWRYRVHTSRFCVVVAFDAATAAVVVTAWRKR